MDLHRSVIEGVSWRLASTLVRRHPHLTLFRAHPGGGMYDLLWLKSAAGTDIRLNRVGTIQVHGREDGRPARQDPVSWLDYLATDSPLAFVERLEAQAGLAPPNLCALTRPSLTYKVIADLACLGLLTEPFKISEGFVDSSGQSGSFRAPWWDEMRLLDPDLAAPQATDLCGEAGYRFWRVERSDFQMTFESSTASMWPELEVDMDDIADDRDHLDAYRYDLVAYASVEGFLEDPDASSGDWSLAQVPWPSSASHNHVEGNEFYPMARLLRAVLELGER